MLEEKAGGAGETGEDEGGTGLPSSRSPQSTPPIFPPRTPLPLWALHCFSPTLGCALLLAFVSSLGPGSSPPTPPLLCSTPQLQQTEAELRKVDEAIALFQKML